ncbi:hypothetical protein [Streptomyces sp. OK228]|uniref:hypothetical protein n=1 Tax=Streptomyces sp. OK228 TaxID=1882786 RepID=UPI000BDD4C93|nr:hypothetical protein [Streptomyces sp. OK228]SOE25667.1 hypothetical protein SAMN05442782_2410 [Streptomyces sp. OK228]
MYSPLQPRHPPPQPVPVAPAAPPQIGIDSDGRPIYGWPQQPAVAPQQPIVARPWGMYLAGGCAAVFALAFLGVIAFFLLIGLAIVAAVLALVAVALTICVVVLRDMWRQSRD